MTTSCKWWRAGLGVGLVSSFWAASVGAATFSANPNSDAFVTTGPSANFSGNNYGAAGGLAVSAAGLPKGGFQIEWMQNDSGIEGTGTPNAPAITGITFASLQNGFTSPVDESLGTFSFNGATTGAANFSLTLTPGFASDLVAGTATSLRLV